jgi:hypothetical protein
MPIPCFVGKSGRWVVPVEITFPRLRVYQQPFKNEFNFMLDTGADGCILLAWDAIDKGLPYGQLSPKPDQPVAGVTGSANFYKEPVILKFRHSDGVLYCYTDVPLLIEPQPEVHEEAHWGYGLLGRNILDRWHVTLRKHPPIKASLDPIYDFPDEGQEIKGPIIESFDGPITPPDDFHNWHGT